MLKLKHLLDNIFKANETLTKDLNVLAYNKKIRDEIMLKDLNNKLSESLSKVEDLSSKIEESTKEERDIDNKIAVCESNISQSKDSLKVLKEKVNSLRNQLNIMLLDEIDSDITNFEKNRADSLEKINRE